VVPGRSDPRTQSTAEHTDTVNRIWRNERTI
jgi:hypothetical protein